MRGGGGRPGDAMRRPPLPLVATPMAAPVMPMPSGV